MKKDKIEGALGFEPRTYRSAVDCSTTELYPHLVFKRPILTFTNLGLEVKFGKNVKTQKRNRTGYLNHTQRLGKGLERAQEVCNIN